MNGRYEEIEMVEISEHIRNGLSVRQNKEKNGLPITRIETIWNEIIDPDRVGYADINAGEKDGWLLKKGDILISHINSKTHLGKCALYAGFPEKLIHGMNLLCLRPNKNKVVPNYLIRILQSPQFKSKIPSITKDSVNQSSFNVTNFRNLTIPLPPLEEQQRIAAILDKADSIRRKRQAAIQLADDFLRATFLDMFGDPVTNPKGWPSATLWDFIHSAKDGPHVSPKYSGKGIPFLSTRHVRPGKIIWEDSKYISREEAEKQWKKCKPEKGDILYTKGGTTGIAAVFDSDQEIAVWVHVALLKTNHEKADSVWLESMLNTAYCYSQSQRFTHGITNKDLGLTRMVNIKMYSPPLDFQKKFSKIVATVKNSMTKHIGHADKSDNLFNSLTQRAFRGEL